MQLSINHTLNTRKTGKTQKNLAKFSYIYIYTHTHTHTHTYIYILQNSSLRCSWMHHQWWSLVHSGFQHHTLLLKWPGRNRFKDCKNLPKTIQHISGQWEKMALDRSQWCKLIHVSIESFENSHVQYATYKWSVRKGKQGPAAGSQSHYINCEICGKLSHLLVLKTICANISNLQLLHHNNHVSQINQQYPVCCKICRNLAGLKSSAGAYNR